MLCIGHLAGLITVEGPILTLDSQAFGSAEDIQAAVACLPEDDGKTSAAGW